MTVYSSVVDAFEDGTDAWSSFRSSLTNRPFTAVCLWREKSRSLNLSHFRDFCDKCFYDLVSFIIQYRMMTNNFCILQLQHSHEMRHFAHHNWLMPSFPRQNLRKIKLIPKKTNNTILCVEVWQKQTNKKRCANYLHIKKDCSVWSP